MKIKLPLRETYSVIAFLFICFFPSFINAQCGTCGDQTPSDVLDGCPTNVAMTTGVFNLSTISGVDSDSIRYYDDCPGNSGTLTGQITGGNITAYAGVDDEVIYIEELDGNGDCDTVYTRELNILQISVEIDMSPADGGFCAGSTSVTLTANPDNNNQNPPNYAWNTPTAGTPTGTSISAASAAGPYSVSMTDISASGVTCTVESPSVMLDDQAVVIANVAVTNVTCNGLSTGSYSVTVTGGSLQYDYKLYEGSLGNQISVDNNEGTSVTFSGLAAGDEYFVVVEDDGGASCEVSNSNAKQAITQPAPATVTLNGVAPSTFGGSDGVIEVERSVGAPDYDWVRTGSGTTTGTSTPANFDITGVPSGSYSVTVTDDNGCVASGGVTVPAVMCSIGITGTNPTAPSCTNGDDGTVVVSSSGYSGAYTITWSGEESGTSAGNTVDDVTINNLDDGNYTFTITDVLTCSATSSTVVVPNPPLITFNTSEAMKTCSGTESGVILVSGITNGSGTYTVTWDGPGSNDGSEGPFTGNSVQLTGLAAGSYSIIVTDSNDCTPTAKNQSVGVLPAVSVAIVGDKIFCSDDGNGILSTSPSSGLSHVWSTGSTNDDITISNPGPNNNATYMVTVTDGAGCTGSAVTAVSGLPAITISLNTSASTTSVTCAGVCDGRIQLNVSGGTNSFTYQWTGPSFSSSAPNAIANLCTGDYFVTVTDTEGCTATFSQSIATPLGISASASGSEPTCNGDSNGSASVSAEGGTLPYTYLWTPGNQTTNSISNLTAGTYTVKVTDLNGCFVTDVVILTEPGPVVGIIAPSSPQICNGQSVSLTVDGGTSFAWSNGLGNEDMVTVTPTTTTTYNVIVTDAATNNCTDVASVTVTVNDLPSAGINVAETSGLENDDRNLCEGDPVTITASGGSTYNWAGGLPNPFTVSPSQGTETYAVTVTDGNGCTDASTVEITINEIPTPVIDFSSANQAVSDVQFIKSNSTANCGTIVQCDWQTDGTPVAGGDCDGISPTFNTQGSKNITLSVLNSCGCSEEITGVLEINASDDCAVEEFTINNSLGVACVGEDLDIITKERGGLNCTITGKDFVVFENGVLLTPGVDYVYTGDKIRFLAPGTYDMRYTITDSCGCSRASSRRIVVTAAPTAGFLTSSQLSGCAGETVNIKFSGFDSGEKVDVMYSNGNIFTYEVDNFDFQLSDNAEETLTITSVQNAVCDNEISGESISINVTPKFEIVSKTTDCTDDGLSYSLTIKTSGGSLSESIVADGIVGITSGTNNYIIPNLDPTKPYNFSLSRGDVCIPVDVDIPMIVCNCTFFVGNNEPVTYSGCEGDVFDISNIFTPSPDFDPVTDTLIYVLHNQQTGLSLGKVFAIYPSTTTQITSNFKDFTPNITMRLSVVGVRRATLSDFDFDNPSSLNNAGAGRCLSVVSGIPLVWFRAPNPALGTDNNSTTICKNAYDFMVFSKNPQVGSTISFSVEGIPEDRIKNYGFQDTVFIHFPDNGQDSFNITITESKVYNDGSTSFTCEGSTTTTLYVEDGVGSPPISEVILWPGNIFASTADSSTTCYQWGYINFGATVLVNQATEKYYYAANDIDFSNTSRVYFVDTYFCDNPDCVTRIFYNDDGPSPGLNYQKEETFSYLIKPNPNQGQFTLDLFSDKEGDFNMKVIDLTGKVVLNKRSRVNVGQNMEDFDLLDVPKGIYFIQVLNTTLNEYSISKIIIN